MIKINGIEQNITESDHLNFQDFINSLNQSLKKDHHVISSIKVDGKELSETDENEIKNIPLKQMGTIDIQTANPLDLASETINTLEFFIHKMIPTIQIAAQNYKSKNLLKGDQNFTKSLDNLDLFIQTIGGLKLIIKLGLNSKVGIIEASLVSIMNDLLHAKRQNNYVFLADLLEKDLVENLNEWKNEAFPIFRSWKSS